MALREFCSPPVNSELYSERVKTSTMSLKCVWFGLDNIFVYLVNIIEFLGSVTLIVDSTNQK